jgi:hypothetical protein
MIKGLSMSGKRRSTSGPGEGKSEGGLSLVEGRFSSQRRRRVSIIKKKRACSKVGNEKRERGDKKEKHDECHDF